MKEKTTQGNILHLLPLLLFALLTLCLVGLSLGGAGVYRAVAERDGAAYQARTAALYLSTRVRQAEDLTVVRFGDGNALCLREDIDGQCYETYIYCHEGWLRELFTAADSGLGPDAGECVLELAALNIQSSESGLSLGLQHENGNGEELFLALCREREVAG